MISLNKLRNFDRDDVLASLGLESRRTATETVFTTLGIFGIGIVVGAGIGLLVAPKPGVELRNDLRQRIAGGEEMLGSFPPVVGSASSAHTPSRPQY